jgi:NAD(P)-dependent dehydrogenase (short-subunit alcohol dehydrogenase family)
MVLDGKTAIVTGGAGGIGRAIAERYLREGASVMIVDMDVAAGAETVAALGKLGKIRFHKANIAERLDVHNMLAATLEQFGDVDILVNNAGVNHRADILDLKEADFERVLKVNLVGPFLAIITMADQLAYAASKGGVDQLTKSIALALAPYGIRVNAIGPGSIMTDMLSKAVDADDARDLLLSRTPLGRIGEPKEIASIAVFLASDDASYITGQTIYADGGRLAMNYVAPRRKEG